MDLKQMCLVIFLMWMVVHYVEAEFFYNHPEPNDAEVQERGLKCKPGRTWMKMQDTSKLNDEQHNDDSDEYEGRRSHMTMTTNDGSCQICVCSAEGTDIYCSKRSARNINECMRMSTLVEQFNRNVPYDHERVLAYRIRRRHGDYLWHKDELPYEPDAKCERGVSYYSSSRNAKDTDIDVASGVDSLLAYTNPDICYYCVCATSGEATGCISRDQIFCQYFRDAKNPNHARDRYTEMQQQDRPAYFRQLSYRLRRTMDYGMSDYVEIGGDTFCCTHPDGHRRNLLMQIRNRVRQLRRKTPKENLLSNAPSGGDYIDFVVNNDK